jgi:membrane protein CcdC involved in cytochrome C biogenesis
MNYIEGFKRVGILILLVTALMLVVVIANSVPINIKTLVFDNIFNLLGALFQLINTIAMSIIVIAICAALFWGLLFIFMIGYTFLLWVVEGFKNESDNLHKG